MDQSNEHPEQEVKTPSKAPQLRGSHKFRLWFIGILLAIVAVMFIFIPKLRILLAVVFVALLAAFGLEAKQTDFDLGKLMQTGSFQESKVTRDSSGNILFDKLFLEIYFSISW